MRTHEREECKTTIDMSQRFTKLEATCYHAYVTGYTGYTGQIYIWKIFLLTSSIRRSTCVILHASYAVQFLFTQNFVTGNGEEVCREQAVDRFGRS